MITTYSHYKNIPLQIIFQTGGVIGKRLLKLLINNFDADKMMLYSGKKLTLNDTNFPTELSGKFVYDMVGNYYILLDTALTYNIDINKSILYYTTFGVDFDNETVTEADVHVLFSKQTPNTIVEGVEIIGSYGLISAENSSKIEKLKIQQDCNIDFDISNDIEKLLGSIKVDFVDGHFIHEFDIVGDSINVGMLVVINENDTIGKLALSTRYYNVQDEIDLLFNFRLDNDVNSDKYLTIFCSNTLVAFGSILPIHKVLHKTNDKTNILTEYSNIANTIYPFSYVSNDAVNFGSVLTEFKINNSIQKYSYSGIVSKGTENFDILNNSDVDFYLTEGVYFGDFSVIPTIENLPIGIERNFNITVKIIYCSDSFYVVLQKLYTYDLNNKLIVFKRLVTSTGIGAWQNEDEHLILAENIQQSIENQFVSQTQIEYWNTIAVQNESVWKQPVMDFSSLATQYPLAQIGWVSYVGNVGKLHVFNGVVWTPIIGEGGEGGEGGADVSGKEDKINKGVANGYVPLNTSIKISDVYLDIVNDLTTGGAKRLASAEMLKTLKINLDTIQKSGVATPGQFTNSNEPTPVTNGGIIFNTTIKKLKVGIDNVWIPIDVTKQVLVSGNIILSDSLHFGNKLIITANCTITINSGLSSGFYVNIIKNPNVVITYVFASGTTLITDSGDQSTMHIFKLIGTENWYKIG